MPFVDVHYSLFENQHNLSSKVDIARESFSAGVRDFLSDGT